MQDVYALVAFIPAVLFALGLIASLAARKTLNPIRGFSPLIVSRTGKPVRYWFGVVLLAAGVVGAIFWGWTFVAE